MNSLNSVASYRRSIEKVIDDYYLLSYAEEENADPFRRLSSDLSKFLFCALVSKVNPDWLCH